MNKPIIAVVGDEPIVSIKLQNRLSRLGYRIVGPFARGEEALRDFRRNRPDLVILDVNLRGELDGIQTAEAIRKVAPTVLIFVATESDELVYERARPVRPAAFLYRPIPDRDLAHAIDLALAAPGAPRSFGEEPDPQLPDGESAMFQYNRLFLKVKDRLCRIMVQDILWVEADDYYCKVVTDEREYLVTKTLKKFSAMLPLETSFVRCHRSYLVNLRRVTEVGDSYILLGHHKLPVSRSRRSEVRQRVGGL